MAPRTAVLALIALSTALWLPARAAAPEPTAGAALAGKRVVGQSLFRSWGFEIYTATLLAAPGFDATRFEQQRLGLELQYHRGFAGRDIAQRSLDEMQGIAPLTPAQARDWLATMNTLFPDVKAGDRILGVHVPGSGARFYRNGTLLGEVTDEGFSARFFGIWLSPRTSQPRLREALIAQARP